MKELIESKWQEILNILVKEHEISEVAVNTWIQPLTIQTISDDSITFFMVRGPVSYTHLDVYKRQVQQNVDVLPLTSEQLHYASCELHHNL